MDPKSALGGPKPISRTGGSLLKNWSYTSNPCIYFSILQDWRSHLAKSLFILHRYLKFIKRADIKNCIGPTYKKPKPRKLAFIKDSSFERETPGCGVVLNRLGLEQEGRSRPKTNGSVSKTRFLVLDLLPVPNKELDTCTQNISWSRPSILCVTHQMSRKKRKDSVEINSAFWNDEL